MSDYFQCPKCKTPWHLHRDAVPACPICNPEKFPKAQREWIESNNPGLFVEVRFRLAQGRLPFSEANL
jgi:hypothetical protein